MQETILDMSSFELAFRKQFLVSSSSPVSVDKYWISEPLWRGYHLLRCPDLNYERYSKGMSLFIKIVLLVLQADIANKHREIMQVVLYRLSKLEPTLLADDDD